MAIINANSRFINYCFFKQGVYDMKEGIIDFVQADERGKFHREAFDISNGRNEGSRSADR